MPGTTCATTGGTNTTTIVRIHRTICLVNRRFPQTLRLRLRRAAPTPLGIASLTWPLHTTHMRGRGIMTASRRSIPLLGWISTTTDSHLRFSWQLLLLNQNISSCIRRGRTWKNIGCTNDIHRQTLRFTVWQKSWGPSSLMTPNRAPRTKTTTMTVKKASHRVHQISSCGKNPQPRLVQDHAHVQSKSRVRKVGGPQEKSNRIASSIPCASSLCPTTGPRGSVRKCHHSPTTHTALHPRKGACTLLVPRRRLGRNMAAINTRVL
jgi:hypothetical protein